MLSNLSFQFSFSRNITGQTITLGNQSCEQKKSDKNYNSLDLHSSNASTEPQRVTEYSNRLLLPVYMYIKRKSLFTYLFRSQNDINSFLKPNLFYCFKLRIKYFLMNGFWRKLKRFKLSFILSWFQKYRFIKWRTFTMRGKIFY